MKSDKIPFLDLKKQYLQIRDEFLAAVDEVFSATAFTNGYSVQSFEKNFAAYCHTVYAAAVNNGTSALHLAMKALDIKEGDEVIGELADSVIALPAGIDPIFSPVVNTVALQLLAYHTAKARGCPIDFPKNLAKSVTVE